ncbi:MULTISPECIES: spore coat protein [Bacillus]|uniref:spore coat protein n=1 Tax=Bacillus TaxID=1386 RepID=UPI002242CC35|nr:MULTISPECIES: spore coat protein [Bacillus]MDN5388146.1 spore coat protein [Bacillus sp. LB7]MEC1020862.1 spore coat protein [Bacillus paralicheniformis]MEC1028692.1 spore coat protein [Bacillus paralicheniformis]MEC1036299.1 spore coat protein [Bacillus paralicheniformis]MEC1050708.1 spore coat protein [Bacillus paralicheniformis]
METRPYSWVALDPECEHPGTDYYPRPQKKQLCDDYSCKCGARHGGNALFDQDFDQVNVNKQLSDETIIIKDSCNITVHTEDTQIAVSILAGIQAGIFLSILTLIDDAELAEIISQDLFQLTANKQANRQKLVIDNSRDVTVTTEDTDIAVAITLALQVFLALVLLLIEFPF